MPWNSLTILITDGKGESGLDYRRRRTDWKGEVFGVPPLERVGKGDLAVLCGLTLCPEILS